MRQGQRSVRRPALVQAVEHAGGEGVAGTVGGDDGFRRDPHRGQAGLDAVRGHGDASTRKMHRHHPAHALPERRPRGGGAGVDVGDVVAQRRETRDGADLGVIDDQVVQLRQARPDQLADALCWNARQLQIGGEAGRTGAAQHRHPAVGVALPGLVHQAMQARQPQMEDTARGRPEIEMIGREKRAHPLVVDVRAAARAAGAVGVDIVGDLARHRPELLMVDTVPLGLVEQEAPFRIVADETDRLDRHRGIELPDVEGEIAARTAAAQLDGQDLGHRIFRWPEVDQLVAVCAPGAAGDEATSLHRISPASAPPR